MSPTPVAAVSRSADGAQWSSRMSAEIGKAVLGQLPIIERLQIALLTGGHVLLEGMPGLAKTLLVKSLSQALGPSSSASSSRRICCPATSSAPWCSRRRTVVSRLITGRSSPTWCWPTKSTARRPRCRARCWRPCRSGRSPSAASRTRCRSLHGHGHPKPGGAGGHLSAAGGAARPFPVQAAVGLPEPGG